MEKQLRELKTDLITIDKASKHKWNHAKSWSAVLRKGLFVWNGIKIKSVTLQGRSEEILRFLVAGCMMAT